MHLLGIVIECLGSRPPRLWNESAIIQPIGINRQLVRCGAIGQYIISLRSIAFGIHVQCATYLEIGKQHECDEPWLIRQQFIGARPL